MGMGMGMSITAGTCACADEFAAVTVVVELAQEVRFELLCLGKLPTHELTEVLFATRKPRGYPSANMNHGSLLAACHRTRHREHGAHDLYSDCPKAQEILDMRAVEVRFDFRDATCGSRGLDKDCEQRPNENEHAIVEHEKDKCVGVGFGGVEKVLELAVAIPCYVFDRKRDEPTGERHEKSNDNRKSPTGEGLSAVAKYGARWAASKIEPIRAIDCVKVQRLELGVAPVRVLVWFLDTRLDTFSYPRHTLLLSHVLLWTERIIAAEAA